MINLSKSADIFRLNPQHFSVLVPVSSDFTLISVLGLHSHLSTFNPPRVRVRLSTQRPSRALLALILPPSPSLPLPPSLPPFLPSSAARLHLQVSALSASLSG
eukprot:951530-Rhodomonas_salina.2